MTESSFHGVVPSPAVRIRTERPGDAAAIRHVNELAFDGYREADTVVAVRAAGAVVLSLVALGEDDGVIAHALVTPVTVTDVEGEVGLVGLGPVSVLPSAREQGVGTQLIEVCLERLRELGHAAVVVLGEPDYYSRFGFIPACRWGLCLEIDAPEDLFMVLELTPGRLGGLTGTVRYRPEFEAFTGLNRV
ncbi:MAG: N-acetyltransferase [Thermoleophilia bacterium]|nr:N-acetyltransferase [Thermoleophilia bacterium]